ncbi:hypothetical protein C0995_005392 [Termitomyces sp. Mi166|nr:hypothetical protein C0995_005392 [Termitomyces sp. Mi166\
MSHISNEQDLEKGNTEIAPGTAYNDTKAGVVQVRRESRIANPVPAGVFAFGASAWLLSMYNVNTRGIRTSNAIVGMGLFGGGLLQFLAGMWEFPRGNVFGATAAYGGVNSSEFTNAFGMYLVVWFMLTVLFIPPIVRRNTAYTTLLSVLAVTLLLLSIAEFTGSARVTKAGGVFGIITGLVAMYIAESDMLAAEKTAFIRLPLGERA